MTAVNEASDIITPEPFLKSMIPLVRDLYCGNDEFGQEATEWIHGMGDKSVKTVLNKHGRVWLYRNRHNEPVAFGSLSTVVWDIDEAPTELQYIPMLGVFYDHQGLPLVPPKYCYQLVDHLIDEAEKFADTLPLLGLAVFPHNVKAIRVYEKSGFIWLKNFEGYNRMILGLSE